MAKKSKRIIKNRNEQNNYRHAINHSSIVPESTDTMLNDSLRGSDELIDYSNTAEQQQKSVPTAFKIRIRKWWEDKRWDIIIGVVLISVIGWLCTSVIDLKIKSAEANIRIEELKEQVDLIASSSVNKDILKLEIESIQKDIDNLNIFSINTLDSRITTLEQQIQSIK